VYTYEGKEKERMKTPDLRALMTSEKLLKQQWGETASHHTERRREYDTGKLAEGQKNTHSG